MKLPGWKTITAPDGSAASWHIDGRFIGFRGAQQINGSKSMGSDPIE
ncbi:hypothetical protein [Motiliproteus sp. MSK22-1]|nr:hypothetical protein [Motiliproteus sp. MSK22-1]